MDQSDNDNKLRPMPTQQTLDIISKLAGFDHILEKVLSPLDWRSLKNATLVSRDWNLALQNPLFWENLIVKQARKDKTFLSRCVSIFRRLGKCGSVTENSIIG